MIKKKVRLLAAIMFTDMVGYTALMQEMSKKQKGPGTGIEKFSRIRLQTIRANYYSTMGMGH